MNSAGASAEAGRSRGAVRITGAMRAVLSLLLFAAIGFANGRDARAEAHKAHFQVQTMGTVLDLTVWGDDDAKAKAAADAVAEEFRRVEQLMSVWVESSDVSRINRAAGGAPVVVDDEVYRVIAFSLEIAKKTRGAFDITVGAYRDLWKFDENMDGSLPTDKEVNARRRMVRWRDVILNKKRKTVKLRRKGMAITLGGIAKGYAVDRAVSLLRDRGITNFILQAGGDLYVGGTKGGKKWRVGIRDPRGARDATFALTEVQDGTFSTSGDYERGFVKDGVRYHHILDPHTGRPANRSRSVTVLAKDAFTADAWSTALFVLGADAGLKLVAKQKDLEAVFVDSKNNVKSSAGLTILEGDIRGHLDAGLSGRVLLLDRPTDGP